MELSISCSSVQVPAIVHRYQPSSRDRKAQVVAIKPSTESSYLPSKCSTNNLLQAVQLRGQSSCSTWLFNGHHQMRSQIYACSKVGSGASVPAVNEVSRFGYACYKFLRPYAVFGTAVASISVFARALVENPNLFQWSLLLKAFPGLIALVFGNAYYTGINQIYDIDIDRVNKPYLPIPAGDLSVKSAWFLVLFYLLAGLSIVRSMNSGMLVTSLYSLGLFLGTIYSVPPIRLKKFSVSTFLVLAAIRGVLLNIGVYCATRAALGLAFVFSPSLAFITVFVTLFIFVISITKDLTDVEGDSKFQVITFAAKFGVRNIALLGTGLLLANYIGAIAAAIYMPEAFKRSLIVPTHTILAVCSIFQAWALEKANYSKEASASFYQFIWRLLYVEYIILPFI